MEKVLLACYLVNMDGMDGCCICFAACEYASGETAHLLDGSLLRITEVFLCDSLNKSMRVLSIIEIVVTRMRKQWRFDFFIRILLN